MACEKCFRVPLSRDDLSIRRQRRLFTSSHLDFDLCACTACGQAFLHVFDETVDWSGEHGDRLWTIYRALDDAQLAAVSGLPDDECAQGVHNELLQNLAVDNPKIVQRPDNRWTAEHLTLPWPQR